MLNIGKLYIAATIELAQKEKATPKERLFLYKLIYTIYGTGIYTLL